MPWNNDNLVLYHGCTELSLHPQAPNGIVTGALPHRIDVAVGNATSDFGQGFYATTWYDQAKYWANHQARRLKQRNRLPQHPRAVVLEFEVARNHLAALDALVFTNELGDYLSFIRYCRAGQPPHRRGLPKAEYDIVYGPVSLFPQPFVVKDSDQVSFHSANAALMISAVTVASRGNPLFP